MRTRTSLDIYWYEFLVRGRILPSVCGSVRQKQNNSSSTAAGLALEPDSSTLKTYVGIRAGRLRCFAVHTARAMCHSGGKNILEKSEAFRS